MTNPKPTRYLTGAQLSSRARAGAYAQHAKYNMTEVTAKARQVFRDSFANRIRKEHPELSDEEVQRRGEAARKLWYAQLSLKSAKARRRYAAKAAKLRARAKGQRPDAPAVLLESTPAGGGRLEDKRGPSQHAEAREER